MIKILLQEDSALFTKGWEHFFANTSGYIHLNTTKCPEDFLRRSQDADVLIMDGWYAVSEYDQMCHFQRSFSKLS